MAAAPTKPALQGVITQTAQVKPNSYSPPGPLGNTTGLIVPDTAPNPTLNAAPAITPTKKEESWWKRWGSDVVHGALDVAGFVPVLGAIPDVINAGVYAAEGDYVQAGISLVAAVPGAGDAVAAGNIAVKAGKQVEKQIVKQAEKQVEKQVEKQAEKQAEKQTEKEIEKEAENTNSSYESGTHEIIKQLLAVVSSVKKSVQHAYQIGKSALQLYSQELLLDLKLRPAYVTVI